MPSRRRASARCTTGKKRRVAHQTQAQIQRLIRVQARQPACRQARRAAAARPSRIWRLPAARLAHQTPIGRSRRRPATDPRVMSAMRERGVRDGVGGLENHGPTGLRMAFSTSSAVCSRSSSIEGRSRPSSRVITSKIGVG